MASSEKSPSTGCCKPSTRSCGSFDFRFTAARSPAQPPPTTRTLDIFFISVFLNDETIGEPGPAQKKKGQAQLGATGKTMRSDRGFTKIAEAGRGDSRIPGLE